MYRYQRSDVHCTIFITAGHSSTLTSGPSAVISGDILTQGIKIATTLQCDLLFILRIIHNSRIFEGGNTVYAIFYAS